MKRVFPFVFSICAFGLLSLPAALTPAEPNARPGRSVAFTFDDLPATRFRELSEAKRITARLLSQIRTHRIPATGFVNEGKLASGRGDEEALTRLLADWLDAGLDLGNHTYSHVRLYDTPIADFQADVLRGERVTARLMGARGRRPRYFRHPTLNTGKDRETKAAFEAFLQSHGYEIAPVTIDNDEYIYARAYDSTATRSDGALRRRIVGDYLRYMEEVFGHYERLSRELLGREPAQVLLLHANALNADCLGELAKRIAKCGYRFVSLETALRDPAYRLRDDYVGNRGPSWLERWAITQGRRPESQPPVPAWVNEAARAPL